MVKDDARVLAIRKLAYATNKSHKTYSSYLLSPESAANCLIRLLNQANYLLDQQLRALEKDLVSKGDFKERYKEVRKNQMFNNGPSDDDILKNQRLRRLANGRVVALKDPE